jgi:hypothetical protein
MVEKDFLGEQIAEKMKFRNLSLPKKIFETLKTQEENIRVRDLDIERSSLINIVSAEEIGS